MTKSFYDTWQAIQGGPLDRAVALAKNATPGAVLRALDHAPVTSEGFCALISDAADEHAGPIEKAARDLTAQRFGRTMNLYIPLYISSYCVNNCRYCWFRRDMPVARKKLTLDEVRSEGERLLAEGYKSVLLVAGEDPKQAPVSYIEECVRLMKEMGFAFVGIETQTMTVDEYRQLAEAGLDSVTVYQETYDRGVYDHVHPSGPKKDFKWRIDAADRVAQSGIRSVGLGVLLGLGDFYREVISLAAHVKHMQKNYWQTSVAVSFPRIHAMPNGYRLENAVSDGRLERMIFAMRLAFPDSVLTLSTREDAALRDRLFGAGINQVSAGSRTSPGAYAGGTSEDGAGEQFPVVDDRTPAQVVDALRAKGLDWVWKDWDVNLKPVS